MLECRKNCYTSTLIDTYSYNLYLQCNPFVMMFPKALEIDSDICIYVNAFGFNPKQFTMHLRHACFLLEQH